MAQYLNTALEIHMEQSWIGLLHVEWITWNVQIAWIAWIAWIAGIFIKYIYVTYSSGVSLLV